MTNTIGRRYILNSAVITTPGQYHYGLIDGGKARDWLKAGSWESTIGYQETADALTALTGVVVGVDRRQISMAVGDEALVFRLTVRMADPAVKGLIGDPGWIADHCEIGLLRKLA
jgi:hypothetical protein